MNASRSNSCYIANYDLPREANTPAFFHLQPFLALSKSATSPRAVADLIERATSAPNTYIFTELLQSPQIQTLAASHPDQLRPHLTLLRIFSHGDYETYEATPDLPPLNDEQRLKLRQLSLLSLAASGRRDDLTYARLRASLGLDSAQQLETLVTTAIYAGLVDAKLDPARQRVQVTRVAPLRDLAPDDAARMRAALRGWSDRCSSILEDVEQHVARVHAGAAARAKAEADAADKMSKAMAEMRDSNTADKKLGAGGAREQLARRGMNKRAMLDAAAKASAADEVMDLDGPFPGEDSKKRASKRKM
ncbi:hypothetical protein PWT90_09993 [Aphanocladium album]|nr:hypothetical protein PWT90_09993 [Aphanocladium album]